MKKIFALLGLALILSMSSCSDDDTNSNGCPSSYNGHTVYTGPQGGCYYINSSGNKVYI